METFSALLAICAGNSPVTGEFLAQRAAFCNGSMQQDVSECFVMLIDVINKGSMPHSGSNNNFTGASLFDLLFSFLAEKYVDCDIYRLRHSLFEPVHFYIFKRTHNASMQELVMHWVQQEC